MGYIGSGVQRFNTADGLTVTGSAEINSLTYPTADGSNGQVLKTNGSGTLSFGTISTDLVNDTSPQLGGDLQSNGNDIVFADNDKAIFGAGSDLQITHTGSHSQIVDSGTGGLFIGGSSQIGLMNAALNEYMVNAVENGAVTLYHDNAAKIATTSSGVSVTGQVIATKGSTGTLATFTDGVATNFTFKTDGSSVGTFGTEAGSTQLAFMVANTEAARFDGSRNLLVGKTALGTANDGLQVKPAGELVVTRDGNHSFILNRKSSDGNIALFQKDGTTVGSIKAGNGDLLIGTGAVNLRFFDATPAVIPRTASDGTSSAVVDLGNVSNSFKDLYSQRVKGAAGHTGEVHFTGSHDIRFVTNGNEAGRFNSSRDFLVGCTALPSASVAGAGFQAANNAELKCSSGSDTGNSTQIRFLNGNGEVGAIRTASSATSFVTSSDRRLKSNIQDAASASDKIDAIQVRQFDWNADDSHQDYGLIAQELQPIEPLAVSGDADSDKMMGVDYSKLVPMLIKEIQELRGRVAALEAN